MNEPWTLDEASKLVKAIKTELMTYGFQATLGGSVLYSGRSKHDIDLYFIPAGSRDESDPRGLVTKLAKTWGKPRNLREDDAAQPTRYTPSLQLQEPSGLFPLTPSMTWSHRGPASGQTEPARRVISSNPPEINFGGTGVFEELGDDAGLSELRRVASSTEWSFQDQASEGTFRYLLRFYRGPDTIDVSII